MFKPKHLQTILAISVTVVGSLSFAQQTRRFSRTGVDLQTCIDKFKSRLNIPFQAEAERVCSNYTDENLNCAVGIMMDYKVPDHQHAIRVCILKFKSAGEYRCALDTMGRRLRAGDAVDVPSIIWQCEGNGKHAPAPPTYDPRPQPKDTYVPPSVPERRYSNRRLLGKMSYDKFIDSVATWLKTPVNSIESVQIDPYFWVINSLLEKVAVNLGREVQLYTVDIVVGPKHVKCTGTDFDPKGTVDADERMFTLHECKIHDSLSDFNSQFRNLDYDFLNKISSDFKMKMLKFSKQKGSGNINFNRETSQFLIVPY